ncbi:MAG: hypothetical protein ABIK32_01810 [Chloroflexota bacterium]|nr:hypothetical protein [Chloroflexota bacterium]
MDKVIQEIKSLPTAKDISEALLPIAGVSLTLLKDAIYNPCKSSYVICLHHCSEK